VEIFQYICFGLAIFLNVRSAALDPKAIPTACRAAASGEKNNSLYKVSFRPEGDYYKTTEICFLGLERSSPLYLLAMD
jgi:hypothetical protein